jgi:hypothetical protein
VTTTATADRAPRASDRTPIGRAGRANPPDRTPTGDDGWAAIDQAAAPRTRLDPAPRVPWAVGVVAWTGVVTTAVLYGTLAVDRVAVSLRAAPLMGTWGWRWDGWQVVGMVPAAAVGTAVVAWGPALAVRLRWRALLAAAAATAAAWTMALAASDGWHRVTAPLATRHEYEPVAAGIGSGLDDIGAFLAGYVAGLRDQPIHVQGHPPGPVVIAWLADRAGLGGAGWLAALAVAGWAVAAAAALVAARAVAGERAARHAAPALAVLPAAVWAGTSLDALFAGFMAAGIAGAVVAHVRGSTRVAIAAGAVLGLGLLCSYGAAVTLAVPALAVVALAAARPSWGLARWAGAIALGVVAMLLAAGAAGFSWLDGLATTRDAYWDGVAADRPALYLTVAGNPAALALAAGPAVAAGLAVAAASAWRRTAGAGVSPEPASVRRGRRDARTPERAGAGTGVRPARTPQRASAGTGSVPPAAALLLPAGAVLAAAAADLSQLSRGEVERIWLPLVPWLALAAPGDRRGWLAAQVAVALAVQLFLRSPW